MSYDAGTVQRMREGYSDLSVVAVEKKMFGGIAFMVDGHMSCGVVKADLMARVGPVHYETALGRPHAREMDFTGRPMKGFVFVAPAGFESDEQLAEWLRLSVSFIKTLAPK